MKVSIVIPAYNEEVRIAKTLPHFIEYAKVFSKKYNLKTEIIVVNDGSVDNTLQVLDDFKQDIKILSYSPNKGKGYALRQGVEASDGDYIYIADSDLSTPIEYIDHFFEAMKGYDCVIGSRNMGNKDIKVSFLRKTLGKVGNLLIRLVLGINFKDTQCGFKMFTREAGKYLIMCKNDRFGYDFEFLYLLQRGGMEIKEMPVKWSAVGDSRVKPISYFKTLQELLNVKKNHD